MQAGERRTPKLNHKEQHPMFTEDLASVGKPLTPVATGSLHRTVSSPDTERPRCRASGGHAI